MIGEAATAARRTSAIAWIALAIIAAGFLWHANLRGSWLDEYWTLDLSDIGRTLPVLVRDAWLHDAHPPIFTAWATLLSALGVHALPALRLLSNLPALLLVFWSAHAFSRAAPDQRGFHYALLLLVFSVPAATEAFANFRSYFWQLAGLTILIQLGRHLAFAGDYDRTTDRGLLALGVIGVVASIMLHYVGGLFGCVIVAGLIALAFARGHRRWAIRLLIASAVACMLLVGMVALQAPNWARDFDKSWIGAFADPPLAIIGGLAVRALLHNPLAFIGLWTGRNDRDRRRLLFLATMATILILGIVGLLTVNIVRPIIVGRYLLAISVLICAILADIAASLDRDWRLFAPFALFSALVSLMPLRHGASPQWDGNARTIAAITAACPSTRVYAASGWLIREGSDWKMARLEDRIFNRGYRTLAADHHFPLTIIGRAGPTNATPGICPVLLWIEHTPVGPRFDPDRALTAAQLQGIDDAHLSVIRSDSGFIIRADKPE